MTINPYKIWHSNRPSRLYLPFTESELLTEVVSKYPSSLKCHLSWRPGAPVPEEDLETFPGNVTQCTSTLKHLIRLLSIKTQEFHLEGFSLFEVWRRFVPGWRLWRENPILNEFGKNFALFFFWRNNCLYILRPSTSHLERIPDSDFYFYPFPF